MLLAQLFITGAEEKNKRNETNNVSLVAIGFRKSKKINKEKLNMNNIPTNSIYHT